jgi:hypothetical protein
MSVSKKLTSEEIEKITASYKKQWRRFRDLLRSKKYKDLPFNDQVTLVDFTGKKKKTVVHGKMAVVKHIKDNMPGLSMSETFSSGPVATPGILTYSQLKCGGNPVDVFILHDAKWATSGTYAYKSAGDYTALWIHQDECFPEIIYIEFRE